MQCDKYSYIYERKCKLIKIEEMFFKHNVSTSKPYTVLIKYNERFLFKEYGNATTWYLKIG